MASYTKCSILGEIFVMKYDAFFRSSVRRHPSPSLLAVSLPALPHRPAAGGLSRHYYCRRAFSHYNARSCEE